MTGEGPIEFDILEPIIPEPRVNDLTKREHYAAVALNALICTTDDKFLRATWSASEYAEAAVELADALVKELAK